MFFSGVCPPGGMVSLRCLQTINLSRHSICTIIMWPWRGRRRDKGELGMCPTFHLTAFEKVQIRSDGNSYLPFPRLSFFLTVAWKIMPTQLESEVWRHLLQPQLCEPGPSYNIVSTSFFLSQGLLQGLSEVRPLQSEEKGGMKWDSNGRCFDWLVLFTHIQNGFMILLHVTVSDLWW